MTARYMIYLPADAPGRLIRCKETGGLPMTEMQTLVDGPIKVLDTNQDPTWAREPVDGIRMVAAEEDDPATIKDTFLCVEVNGELLGFAKPVAKTICEEWGLEMEENAWKD